MKKKKILKKKNIKNPNVKILREEAKLQRYTPTQMGIGVG